MKSICARTPPRWAAAIKAASLAWNNSQVEDEVHRLKLVKRQK
jgi:hypothetical protein